MKDILPFGDLFPDESGNTGGSGENKGVFMFDVPIEGHINRTIGDITTVLSSQPSDHPGEHKVFLWFRAPLGMLTDLEGTSISIHNRNGQGISWADSQVFPNPRFTTVSYTFDEIVSGNGFSLRPMSRFGSNKL